MEEAQVTEESAEASSYEVLQSLTQSEMGMSLKSLPESPKGVITNHRNNKLYGETATPTTTTWLIY